MSHTFNYNIYNIIAEMECFFYSVPLLLFFFNVRRYVCTHIVGRIDKYNILNAFLLSNNRSFVCGHASSENVFASDINILH